MTRTVEVRHGLRAQPGPVQEGDLTAQRHTGDDRPWEGRVGEGDRHVSGETGAEAVGDAGSRVLLVDDDRYAAATSSKVGGSRDIAAEPHNHVGIDVLDRGRCCTNGSPQVSGQSKQVCRRLAG